MTKLRDQETERGDFIFHADRLSTLIVEKALTLLPYEAQTVQTPLKLPYDGLTRAKEVSYHCHDVFTDSSLIMLESRWNFDITIWGSVLPRAAAGHQGCTHWCDVDSVGSKDRRADSAQLDTASLRQV